MADPFISEIRVFSFNFPPKGWAFCNGQQMQINQNQALFALLGTTYGGDGVTTFNLPNLRGRTPIHMGNGHTLGEAGGATSVTITQQTMPTHNHMVTAVNALAPASDEGVYPDNTKFVAQPLVALQNGQTVEGSMYGTGGQAGALKPTALTNTGGSQAHTNMMPYLTMNFCMALLGIFPSRN
jgi:microcystin-dependent protein